MINLYTSYYDNISNLPDDLCPISIAGKAHVNFNGIEYKKLAPKLSFWKIWEQTKDNNYYIEKFNELVLSKLNCQQTYNEILNLSNGKIPCLICYEKPDEFCHRHIVSEWFKKELNINVEEY